MPDPTPTPDADATWLENEADIEAAVKRAAGISARGGGRLRSIAARLRAQAAALAEAERERDEAIKEHGKESGFWGTAAARCLARAEAAEATVRDLKDALASHAIQCPQVIGAVVRELVATPPEAPNAR